MYLTKAIFRERRTLHGTGEQKAGRGREITSIKPEMAAARKAAVADCQTLLRGGQVRRKRTSVAVARLGPELGGQPGHAKVGEKAKPAVTAHSSEGSRATGLFFFLSQKKDLKLLSIIQQMFIGVF